jgi:hypothetical protein
MPARPIMLSDWLQFQNSSFQMTLYKIYDFGVNQKFKMATISRQNLT